MLRCTSPSFRAPHSRVGAKHRPQGIGLGLLRAVLWSISVGETQPPNHQKGKKVKNTSLPNPKALQNLPKKRVSNILPFLPKSFFTFLYLKSKTAKPAAFHPERSFCPASSNLSVAPSVTRIQDRAPWMHRSSLQRKCHVLPTRPLKRLKLASGPSGV